MKIEREKDVKVSVMMLSLVFVEYIPWHEAIGQLSPYFSLKIL